MQVNDLSLWNRVFPLVNSLKFTSGGVSFLFLFPIVDPIIARSDHFLILDLMLIEKKCFQLSKFEV